MNSKMQLGARRAPQDLGAEGPQLDGGNLRRSPGREARAWSGPEGIKGKRSELLQHRHATTTKEQDASSRLPRC